jgi:multidrug efflux pump subunit AcrB
MQDIAPSLPEGAQGPSVNDEFDDTYGTIYAIPDGYSLEEVRQRVETIRRELMSVPDIGKTVCLASSRSRLRSLFHPPDWPVWGSAFSRLRML